MQENYAPSAAPGGMPAGGETPSAPGPEPTAGWDAPESPHNDIVDGDSEASQPTAETAEAATAPPPPAAMPQAPAAPAAAPAAPPLTPIQQDLGETVKVYYQVAQQISQELPARQMQRQQLEQSLAPYAQLYQQNPAAFQELPPQVQATIQQQYQQWQAVSQREQALRQGQAQIERDAPALQAYWGVEQQKAQLNRVAEPLAYQMLAQREASRAPDPASFPTDKLTAILKRVPPNALEATASAFGELMREQRQSTRAEQRVDDMGPGMGANAGQSYDRMDPVDLFKLDAERAAKRRG